MKIYKVDKNNTDIVAWLDPAGLLSRLSMPHYHALAAFDDKYTSGDPEALLIVALTDAYLSVEWIAVDPDYQSEGIGTGLLDYLISGAGDRKVLVNFPSDPGVYPLMDSARIFFEVYGFQPTNIITDVWIRSADVFPIGEMIRVPIENMAAQLVEWDLREERLPKNVVLLKDLSDEDYEGGLAFGRLLGKTGGMGEIGYYPRDKYDSSISCAIRDREKVVGMLLVRRISRWTLRVDYVFAGDGASKHNLRSLIHTAIERAVAYCQPGTEVELPNGSPEEKKWIRRLFMRE